MKLRRLNNVGIERFQIFLDAFTSDIPLPVPLEALTSPETSEYLSDEIEMESRPFSTRLEIGQYLNKKFGTADIPSLDIDRGLWTWLGLYYFEALCPIGSKPGNRARWILEPHKYNRYYRHILAAPFRIVRYNFGNLEAAMCVLCQPPSKPGDLVEQITARQELVTNKTLLRVATKLYFDPMTNKLKPGAGGKGDGSPRRLASVVSQFDVTFDLYSLNDLELLQMLPLEFNRFRDRQL